MFDIGLYRENIKKIFLSETLRHRALIFGMQHHLVDLYKVSSNYVRGAKNGPSPPQVSYVLLRLIWGKHEKIFLSETLRPRALIFGMQHHLVDLYQVYSNYDPGAKNGSAPGVICFT